MLGTSVYAGDKAMSNMRLPALAIVYLLIKIKWNIYAGMLKVFGSL